MNGSVRQFKLAANFLANLCIQCNPSITPPPIKKREKKAKQSHVLACDDAPKCCYII